LETPLAPSSLFSSKQLLAVASELYLRPLASILLIRSAWVGAGLWILLLQEPRLAVVAFLALSVIEAIGQVMARGDGTVFGAMTRANALLCSLAMAWLLAPMGLLFLLELVFVFAALCVGLYFTLIFRRLLRDTMLPPVIWPYSLIAAISVTLFPFGVPDSMAYFGWPVVHVASIVDLPRAFLQCMGVFLFSPWVLSGIVVSVLVLAWSPAMFVAGIAGWLSGALTSMALVTVGLDPNWAPASYNFFLSGMALGAVFFLPSARGLAIAVFAGMIAALFAALLKVFLGTSGIAYLPIPFGLTLFSGILALANPAFEPGLRRNINWFERPEDAWLRDRWVRARWGDFVSLLAVPLVGELQVTQGFDSTPSHRGAWRHALDFQRPPKSSQERRGRPTIMAEAVYSPVMGEVVDVRSDVEDNPQGTANYGDNWGNHVMVRMHCGDHVLLAHLQQGSVAVVPGQRVSYTSFLGSVGNSGRSTVAHLHMQVQADRTLGAPTKPFNLANYHSFSGKTGAIRTWHAAGIPNESEVIVGARNNPEVHRLLTSMGPGRAIWTVTVRGDVPIPVQSATPIIAEIRLSAAGTYQFTTSDNAEAEYKADPDGLRVIRLQGAQRAPMALAAVACPTIPFCAQAGLRWTDPLPITELTPMQYFRKVLSPFEVQAFTTIACECLAEPDTTSPELVIRGRPVSRAKGLPISCTMTLVALRGAVRIVAEYPNGELVYEAASFEPHSM
jgi:hypothetical protein